MSLREVWTVEILSEEIKPKSKVCYFVLNLIKNALTKKKKGQSGFIQFTWTSQFNSIYFYLYSVCCN